MISHNSREIKIQKINENDVDEKIIAQFMPDIYKKLEWLERDQLIKHFVSTEFNRYLSYYKNARDINVSTNSKNQGRKNRDKNHRKNRNLTTFSGFYINVGFQNKMNPGRLMSLINESLRSSNALFGNIEIMKTFSFFEIEEGFESKLIQSFKGKRLSGISLEIEKDKERIPIIKRWFNLKSKFLIDNNTEFEFNVF